MVKVKISEKLNNKRKNPLCVFVFEGEKIIKEIGIRIPENVFSGKEGELVFLSEKGKIYILCGLGKKKTFSPVTLLNTSGKLGYEIRNKKITGVSVLVRKEFKKKEIAKIYEGVLLGNYRFPKKEEDKKAELGEICFENTGIRKEDLKFSELLVRATYFSRDLANTPPNIATPIYMAEKAKEIAEKSKNIEVHIFDEKEIVKRGFNAFYGVAKGSNNPPRFIHLVYKPKRAKKKIVLIGKTITFDSGGLSLKPPSYMLGMKYDKSGGCDVLGIFSILDEWNPPYEIHGILPACENMPSGTAQRPDDVVTAYNGKKIEIISTDAEGRLTLADALAYASELKPDYIIDFATLTGACVVALGDYTAGLFTDDEFLKDSLLKASKKAGESLWHMPLDKKLKEKIKTKFADVKNSGGREGGAITASLFLKEFVDEKIPWAHVDIAGPSFNSKFWGVNPEGGSGFLTRTLIEWIRDLK